MGAKIQKKETQSYLRFTNLRFTIEITDGITSSLKTLQLDQARKVDTYDGYSLLFASQTKNLFKSSGESLNRFFVIYCYAPAIGH